MHAAPLVTSCLAELAQVHRAPEPVFDTDGFARIPTENGLTFEVYLPHKSTQLIVFFLLGALPQKNRTPFLLEALRANLDQHRNSDSVLAYHEEENLLTVQQRRELDELDPVSFQRAMSDLKTVADFWRGKLEQLRRQANAQPEHTDPTMPIGGARLHNLFA